MRLEKRNLALLACGVLGLLLTGAPKLPDADFGRLNQLGAFLVFVFWSGACLAWGRVCFDRLQLRAANDLEEWITIICLGALLATAAMIVAGHLGALGPQWRGVAILVLAFGLFFDRRQDIRLSFSENRVFVAVLVAAIAFRLLRGVQLSGHGDALYYHLYAPRLWFDVGRIQFFDFFSMGFQAGSWEYLYLWGNLLLAGEPGTGLAAVNHFGQWTHALWGYGGGAVALVALFRQFGLGSRWAMLACLAALSVAETRWTTNLAKNDWGACFWTFAGIYFLFASRYRWLAGACLGAALATKITTSFLVAGALMIWLIQHRPSYRSVFELGLTISLVWLPILLRNAYYTGNPFFPAMDSVFPSEAFGPSLRQGSADFVVSGLQTQWQAWVHQSNGFLAQGPLNHLFLFLPLVWSFRPASRRSSTLWFITTLGFIFYVSKIGPLTPYRLAGPILSLLAGTSIVLIANLVEILRTRWQPAHHFTWILLAYLTAVSEIPVYTLFQWDKGRAQVPARAILAQTGGPAKKWLRQHVSPEEKIFDTGDNENYYISHLKISSFLYDARVDRATFDLKDPIDIVRTLRRLNFVYLYDSLNWTGTVRAGISTRLQPLLKRARQGLLYEDKKSKIFDLRILANSVK